MASRPNPPPVQRQKVPTAARRVALLPCEVSLSRLKTLYSVAYMKTGCRCSYLAILSTQLSEHVCTSLAVGHIRTSHLPLHKSKGPQGCPALPGVCKSNPGSPRVVPAAVSTCSQSLYTLAPRMSPSAFVIPTRTRLREALENAPSRGEASIRAAAAAPAFHHLGTGTCGAAATSPRAERGLKGSVLQW